jgi:hypothetical protein
MHLEGCLPNARRVVRRVAIGVNTKFELSSQVLDARLPFRVHRFVSALLSFYNHPPYLPLLRTLSLLFSATLHTAWSYLKA